MSDELINSGMIQSRPYTKGYAQPQMVYDPNRVNYPKRRADRRGKAEFEKIPWDEALDTIAKKLEEVKEK